MNQIILDGYNVIHKIPQLKHNLENSLENARTSLANFVMTWTKTHTHKGSIAIVFDGRDGIINSSQSICGIKCIFTKTKQEADDRIISMVRNHPNSKEIIVISDDNYVTNNCKAHGAQVRPADFLTQPKSQVSIQDDKHIDSKTEQEITNWLKKQYGM
jgi:predicted RNA-binding protein with PIN domain